MSKSGQTIAAQISYDAKQSYLSEIESAALARKAENAQGLTTYDPHQVGYVEFSTKHGLSASTKGIKVIADNELNVPAKDKKDPYGTAIKVGFILAAVAVSVAAIAGRNTVDKEERAHCERVNSNLKATETERKDCGLWVDQPSTPK